MSRGRARRGDRNLAVAYLRCSTDRQDLSPDAQRQAIDQWATTNNIRVIAYHLDKGVSGRADIADRPELVAALSSLRLHGAGALVVARRDRLARDSLVAQLIERAVLQVGAEVMAADGVGNGDDPASMMVRAIIDAVSAYEVAVIRTRIRAALQVKKAKGERVGSVPFGWSLDVDGRRLCRCQDEQTIIESAGKLREAGMTFRAVASELARLGHKSRSGRVFDPQQIRRMLLTT